LPPSTCASRYRAAHPRHLHSFPTRRSSDLGTQELNWHAVAAAIADTGFQGFVAHEFTPTRDPLTSLSEAVAVCTEALEARIGDGDRKSTRLNSSHDQTSYAVFCLKKKNKQV